MFVILQFVRSLHLVGSEVSSEIFGVLEIGSKYPANAITYESNAAITQ